MGDPLPTPQGLDPRGAELWQRVTSTTKLDVAGEFLLEEACRALDRAERLHWLVTGDADRWANLLPDPLDDATLTLVVSGALVEARQQQQTFRALLGQLKLGRVALEEPAGRSPLDQLAARRAARGATTSDPRRPTSGE